MSWGISSTVNAYADQIRNPAGNVAGNTTAAVSGLGAHRRNSAAAVAAAATVENHDASYVSQVSREFSSALESGLQNSAAVTGYYETCNRYLTETGKAVGLDGDNTLGSAVSALVADYRELAAAPDSAATRSGLLADASAMAGEFNRDYRNLSALRDRIAANSTTIGGGELSARVNEFNQHLNRIGELNREIDAAENDRFRPRDASALRQERDRLGGELSAYADVSVTAEDNGAMTVTLNLDNGSRTLVDGAAPAAAPVTLAVKSTETASGSGLYEPAVTASDDPATALSLMPETGTLRAMIDSRYYIMGRMEEMYQLAAKISSAINGVQNSTAAWDLNHASRAGNLFNVSAAQPAAGTVLSVNPALAADPRKLAASGVSGDRTDGSAAARVAEELDTPDETGVAASASGEQYLSDVSMAIVQCRSLLENTANIETMFEGALSRRGDSGADEELARMLELQRAYQSATRIINNIDRIMAMQAQAYGLTA